jgi:hypothetical protein
MEVPNMKDSSKENQWRQEFGQFMDSPAIQPPLDVEQAILASVHRELHPAFLLIFTKLLVIHSLIGTLSLAFCDQFGVTPFSTGFSLSHYFMQWGGHAFCMLACGFLFIGLSVGLSQLILQKHEWRRLQSQSIHHTVLLSLLSLLALKLFGGQMPLFMGVLWLIGALIGGITPWLAEKYFFNQPSLAR